MAAYAKDLNTAETAYAAIDEVCADPVDKIGLWLLLSSGTIAPSPLFWNIEREILK